METQCTTAMSSFVSPRMPTTGSRTDFHRYLDPSLHRPTPGPQPTLSLDKIFHALLSGLPTGMQWDQLHSKRPALHDTNGYQGPKRWSNDGSYHTLVPAAILPGQHTDQLDTSVLPGEGSNPVGTQGASASALLVIRTRQGTKH